MHIMGGMNNTPSTNSSSNNKKAKKKTPIKNNNKKPLINNKPNNMNHNVNNVNNIRTKGPTLIQGELIQDSATNAKININPVVKRSVNINPVNPINSNNQMNSLNFKPIYNSQNLKIESNNALLNIHPEPNIKEREREVNLYKKTK